MNMKSSSSQPLRFFLVSALLVSVAVSGCFGHSTKTTETSSTSSSTTPSQSPTTDCQPPSCNQGGEKPPQPALPRRFELNDCHAYYVGFVADTGKMAALLPSGYSPKPTAATAQQAALDVFT
ncbi:MAG: hypothetical protein LC623_03920, partial [Halobacteriales archaeon]|nr:hypothetical protein [Halobacteriales archaeon]